MPHIYQVVVQSSHDGFQAVRLFHLKLVEDTRTPALHSVQMRVSEQHSSVEWSEESDVMAAAAAETPSTEVLAASATEGVSVVMETAALSLLTGVLSLSVERSGAWAVMETAGSENPRDPSAMVVSPPAGMALSLSSVGMACWW